MQQEEEQQGKRTFVSFPMVKPDSLEERRYQVELADICYKENTLAVLPTGLGKTAIALLTIARFLSSSKNARCLVMAPTRVLVHQHYSFLTTHLLLSPEEIGFLTGEDDVEDRQNIWSSKRLICATPQVTESDIRRKQCKIADFSFIVFDEVHRASGNHAYTTIASLYKELKPDGRVLGMTASLPSDRAKVDEIVKTLGISKIEIRDEESADVKPYVFKTNAQWIELELSPVLKGIQSLMREALESRLKLIEDASLIKRNKYGSITLKDLLKLRLKVGQIKSSQLKSALFSSIRLHHALNLIETQSLSAYKSFMDRLMAKGRKGFGMSELLNDKRVAEAYEQARGALVSGIEHPKIAEVLKICRRIKAGERALVFASYRDTVDQIHSELVKNGLRAGYLIGKSGERGQSQKLQVKALEDLKSGVYDILVATQVGEEGLDVAECNLVVFYDNVPSAIRFVQRKGRTGRRREGEVYVLITKGTRDQAYYWLSKRRAGEARRLADSIGGKEKHGPMDDFFSAGSSDEVPTILIDTREISQFADKLRARGARVEVRQLDVGDYVLSSDVAVERKTLDDFVKSVFDGRLFTQLVNIAEKYPRAILIIQGERKHAAAVAGMGEAQFYGALASVLSDFKIPVFFASDERDVCEVLYHIARREQLEKKKKELRIREGRKPATLVEIQKYIVAGIPGVDAVLADRLLGSLGTIEHLFSAEEKDLLKVEGIGAMTAHRIREIASARYVPSEPVPPERQVPPFTGPQVTFDQIDGKKEVVGEEPLASGLPLKKAQRDHQDYDDLNIPPPPPD